MSKVMLVEDDNNLREIYEARLQAEGYTIVTAHDGEEALVVAKNEQPDLIISDVMMPKISGFEMLDILRNTEGLKDVKVIMLTALGQSDDQQRADRLGADSYLVKSQVTLEDIVKVAGRLLGNEDEAAAEAPAAVAEPEATAVTEPVAVAPDPVAVTPTPVVEPTPMTVIEPVAPVATEVAPLPVPAPIAPTAPTEPTNPIAFGAPAPVPPAPVVSPATTFPNDTTQPPATAAAPPPAPAPAEPTAEDLFMQNLGASTQATIIPAAQPLAEEAATVEAQIADFEKANSPAPTQVEPTPVATEATTPTETGSNTAVEQFVTTAPPDLTTAVDPTVPTAQSAGNDDVLADALHSLTGQAPEAINVTAVPPLAEPAASNDPTVARGGNRVITPLDAPSKPDIGTLLAIEEAKEIANAPVTVAPVNSLVTPPVPAPVISPAVTNQTVDVPVPSYEPTVQPAATQPPAANQPFDPNSIAL